MRKPPAWNDLIFVKVVRVDEIMTCPKAEVDITLNISFNLTCNYQNIQPLRGFSPFSQKTVLIPHRSHKDQVLLYI